MTGKIRMFLLAMAASAMLTAVPAHAEEIEDNSSHITVGCAEIMDEYYDAVENGDRRIYHYRTQIENLDAAKEEALEGFENLGVVDIGKGYLNLRRKPSKKGNIFGKLLDGFAMEILGEEGDWYLVSSGGLKGYVKKQYIKTGEEAREKAWETMQLRIQINTETLNVRAEADDNAEIWTHVKEKESYPVVEDLGDWIEIEMDTSNGFVSSEYVSVKYSMEQAIEVEEIVVEDKVSGTRKALVDYAMQFLGNPYVWGGESLTQGCDCSGFVMLLYRKYGIDLPHYSVDQSKYGKSISSNKMKKGDLVFYAGSDGVINHVTMYIGNGQIIGAQSRRTGITIKSWDYRPPVKIISLLD